MTRDEIRRLIGGYATGTLTDSERTLLFEAALDDQNLFDELAREDELRELLAEPGVRQRLVQSLAPREAQPPVRWWMRPWPVAALASMALAILIVVAVARAPRAVEIAAVTSAPVEEPRPVNALAPEAPPAAPQNIPAAEPVRAKAAPQTESALLKDSAPALAPPPAQTNEIDRIEQATIADALQQQQGQQQGGQSQTPAEQQTKLAAQATQPFVAGEQRRDQAASGPPAVAGGAFGRGAAAPKLAAAQQVVANQAAALAFTWTIENNVLRVTPLLDGALRIEAPPGDPRVVNDARRAGVIQFPIPAGAASVRILFGNGPLPADALARSINFRSATRDRGTVTMPANGPAVVEIPLQ